MNVFDLFAKIELDNKGYVRTLDATERATDTASRNMDNAFTRRIDNMRRRLNDFGSAAQRIGGNLSRNLTTPIAAAGGAALLAADRFADVADAVDKSAQAAGLSAEDYQTLRFAFDQSGIAADGFDQALFSLNRRLGLAAQGNKTYQQAFEDLGVATRDVNGDVRTSREVFDDLIAALGDVPSSAEQAALASVVFGDDVGKRLLPVINAGTDGLGDLEQQARDLGIVMTGEAINDLVEYKDEMNALRQSFQTAGVEIVRELLPLLRDFATFLQDTVVPRVQSLAGFIGDLVAKWQELPQPVRDFATVITTTFAAAGPALTAIGSLSRVLGGVIALLTGPVGWVAGIGLVVTALTVTLVNALNKHERDLETYKDKIQEVADVLGDADDKESLRGKLDELAEFLPDDERNGWKDWAQDAIDAAEDAGEAQDVLLEKLLASIAAQELFELERRRAALSSTEDVIASYNSAQIFLAETYVGLQRELGELEVGWRNFAETGELPVGIESIEELNSRIVIAEAELSDLQAHRTFTRDIAITLAPALVNRERFLGELEELDARLQALRDQVFGDRTAADTRREAPPAPPAPPPPDEPAEPTPLTAPQAEAFIRPLTEEEALARMAARREENAERLRLDRELRNISANAEEREQNLTDTTIANAKARAQAQAEALEETLESTRTIVLAQQQFEQEAAQQMLHEAGNAETRRRTAAIVAAEAIADTAEAREKVLTDQTRAGAAARAAVREAEEHEAGNAATRAATAAITSAQDREDVLEAQYDAYLERRRQTTAENARIELEQQTRFNSELRRLEEQNVAARERSTAAAAERESQAANAALALRASQIASANERERLLNLQYEAAEERRLQAAADNARVQLEQEERFNAELRRLEADDVAARERSLEEQAAAELIARDARWDQEQRFYFELRRLEEDDVAARERSLAEREQAEIDAQARREQAAADVAREAANAELRDRVAFNNEMDAIADAAAARELVLTNQTEEAAERRRQVTEEEALAERDAQWDREQRFYLELQRLNDIDVERTQRAADNAEERERIRQQEIAEQEAYVEALGRAMNNALKLAGGFNSAINNLTNSIGNAFANILLSADHTFEDLGNAFTDMVNGVGTQAESMANILAASAVAFTTAIGEMVGAAITGGEGIGEGLAQAALSLIQQMATMIIATHVTAVVMGNQVWNPVLMALGIAGALAATAGLSVLAAMGADTSERTADTGTTRNPMRFTNISESDAGSSVGRAPQGVQIAVTSSLRDAADMFGSHVDSFGAYVGRLVTEGITVDVGTASRTAALR